MQQLGVVWTHDLVFRLAILVCSELLYSGLQATDDHRRRDGGNSQLAAGWSAGNRLDYSTISQGLELARRSDLHSTCLNSVSSSSKHFTIPLVHVPTSKAVSQRNDLQLAINLRTQRSPPRLSIA